MDRSLDEVISERQRPGPRGRGSAPRSGGPRTRDSYRKPRDDQRDPDDDHWVHDRFEGDRMSSREPREYRSRRDDRIDRYEPDADRGIEQSAKIRVDQLHYDLTEQDLKELFTRKGPISSLELLYDRAGRSRGIAYVTYTSARDADRAIREYDGAKALDQTIKLTLVPTGPSTNGRGRGSGRFDAPGGRDSGRSLFDRIDTRRRSESPRRAPYPKPAPDNVDRYVPRDSRDGRESRDTRFRRRSSRSRSPVRGRRGGGVGATGGRGGRGGARKDDRGRPLVGGRPRMTANELDADMDSYWGSIGKDTSAGVDNASAATTSAPAVKCAPEPAPVSADGDIDMIE